MQKSSSLVRYYTPNYTHTKNFYMELLCVMVKQEREKQTVDTKLEEHLSAVKSLGVPIPLAV